MISFLNNPSNQIVKGYLYCNGAVKQLFRFYLQRAQFNPCHQNQPTEPLFTMRTSAGVIHKKKERPDKFHGRSSIKLLNGFN